jgi:hypothetical protein
MIQPPPGIDRVTSVTSTNIPESTINTYPLVIFWNNKNRLMAEGCKRSDNQSGMCIYYTVFLGKSEKREDPAQH